MKRKVIFVNRREFNVIETRMTGAEIAALVNVPQDNAVVRRETGRAKGEIPVTKLVSVGNGEHYLVTRRFVDAGCVAYR